MPVALSSIRASPGKPTEVDAAAAAGPTAAAAAAAGLPAKAAAAGEDEGEAAAEEGGEAATANVQQLLQKIPSEFRRARGAPCCRLWLHTALCRGVEGKDNRNCSKVV